MSINWVMLDERTKSFIPLPQERTLFTSPARTSLTLQTPDTYPGRAPLSLFSSGGVATITNQRLIYIPTAPTPALTSFSAPLLHIQDSRITAPLFRPNAFCAVLKPVPGGGIAAHHLNVELRMTFKDGGAYDFHQVFERVKEAASRAVEDARESGREVDPERVHLDELPAYEEFDGRAEGDERASREVGRVDAVVSPSPLRPGAEMRTVAMDVNAPTATAPTPSQPAPPDEPPPGYEEAQSSAVASGPEEVARR